MDWEYVENIPAKLHSNFYKKNTITRSNFYKNVHRSAKNIIWRKWNLKFLKYA